MVYELDGKDYVLLEFQGELDSQEEDTLNFLPVGNLSQIDEKVRGVFSDRLHACLLISFLGGFHLFVVDFAIISPVIYAKDWNLRSRGIRGGTK